MTPEPERRLDRRDLALLSLVFALLAAYVWRTFDFTLPIYEDAAILLRYARHLAEGHGIVWNVGEQPVDGATDFLLMVSVAGLARLGLSIEGASYLLNFVSHALSIVVVYVGVRRHTDAPRWTAVLSAAFLAFGPGIRYAEAHFGTPYFGLWAATSWVLATKLHRRGETTRDAILFAFSGLLLGLTRPEGVFLAGFMLVAVFLARGDGRSWRDHRRTLVWFVAVFGLLGGGYFLWRWNHFGYPLPNTYYIKGEGRVHWGHLRGGTRHLIALTLPVLPVLGAAVVAEFAVWRSGRAPRYARELVFVLFPIVAFVVLGVLHEGLMDYLHRFLYCLLPIVLVGWPPLAMRVVGLVQGPSPDEHQRAVLRALAVVFGVACIGYQLKTFPTGGHRWWGTYNVAQELKDYSPEHVIAVTNAGHLPFVTRWVAVDAWGLNDQEIAHQGLSFELLDRYRPHVIQFDAHFSPLAPPDPGRAETTPWGQGTRVMYEYARANDYVLAAAFGLTPTKAHYYYVRPDFPGSAEIVERIRGVRYHIGGHPARCVDFAALGRE